MLWLTDASDKPKGFLGQCEIKDNIFGAVGFKYIPFTLDHFLEQDEIKQLLVWCTKNQYCLATAFICYQTNSSREYWSVTFMFAGSSIRLELRNNRFSNLILELKSFIKSCCQE
jgi:hypothetical protein